MMQAVATKLTDVRFHGRGGQGVVTASRILAEAAILENKWVHAFPTFGPERSGAPVAAFTRISPEKFSIKTQVYHPHVIVVIDPSLVRRSEVYEGLVEGGTIIINSASKIGKDFFPKTAEKIFYVNGNEIAEKHLGRPIANTVMLGALAKVTGLVELESLIKALSSYFSGEILEKNIAAIKEAYEKVVPLE